MSKPKQIFAENDKRWLDDHAVLWRYVPLRTLFFYLNGLVFIPSVEKLRAGDPFEGEFYEDIAWFNSAFKDYYGSEAQAIDDWLLQKLCSDHERHNIQINRGYPNFSAQVFRRHYFEFLRRTRFAWCWFNSHRESAAMWSVYGNQGVAIQSSIGKICAAFDTVKRDFIYGKMTYVDYKSGVSTDFHPERKTDYRLLLRPFYLKRKEYESEHEVRFVTAGSDRSDTGGILLKGLKAQQWISAIRFWPGLTADEERSIQKAIEQVCPGIDSKKSDLFSGPDDPSDFVQMFSDELDESADTRWADGTDEIPAAVKIL